MGKPYEAKPEKAEAEDAPYYPKAHIEEEGEEEGVTEQEIARLRAEEEEMLEAQSIVEELLRRYTTIKV